MSKILLLLEYDSNADMMNGLLGKREHATVEKTLNLIIIRVRGTLVCQVFNLIFSR